MKKSVGENIFDIVNVLILIMLVVLCLLPIIHVLCGSFSDPAELTRNQGVLLLPKGFTFKGYELVFKNNSILTGYANTVFYVVVGTFINLFMTSLGAYVLSRRGFLWGKYIMIMVMITMFFNGGMIPTYLLVKDLGLLDTRWAIVFPVAISVWNLIVMRTSFLAIPESLEEAARIDGANDFSILFRVVIPLSKAVMAVMLLFYAVAHWNSWFSAMIYLRKRELYPLQLILREILVQDNTAEMSKSTMINVDDLDYYRPLLKYTTIVVATVPILCLYPFIQKYFVKGVMIGSVKE